MTGASAAALKRNKELSAQSEGEVRDYCRANGAPLADRIRLAGILDRGDIGGVPDCTLEVKFQRARTTEANGSPLGGYVDELLAEMGNTGTRWGAVVLKRWGKGRKFGAGSWFAITPFSLFLELVLENHSLRRQVAELERPR